MAYYISSGIISTDTTLQDNQMFISDGGVANKTTINTGGCMVVFDDGTANSTTANSDGVIILVGGTANHTQINDGGYMVISAGTANNTVVSGGGINASGGVVNNATINGGGFFNISSGGVANNTTVNNGDTDISNGGVASNTTVNSKGDMYIFSGGTHLGSLQINAGGVVTALKGSTIDFTVSNRKASDGYLINNLSQISGAPTYTITVSANQSAGTYKLAQGAENFTGSISVGDGTVSYGNLSVNGTALKYNNVSYQLSLSSGNLNLSVDRAVVPVTDAPATDIKNRGFSQVIAWDQNRGTVGMIHNDGKSPAAWGGVWEWSGSDVKLWRVAGAGHFKGSKVDYDGVLLYNGIGNTFAAWTDLNDPSYGYVDLCHVEGSFNTRAIADFDGNEYDDILIFDGNGSFGTVLDGTTYKDIWHVDNMSSNPWKILGAGSFGGAADKLIVENTSNGHLYLWQNNDSSFKTWDWSQTDIGYLDDSKFMVSGDFNGDGTDDIVIQKSNGEMWCWDDGNSADARWIGNLDSTFAVESVGDYNADGKEDILLREQSSGWGGLGFWGAGYAGNWTDMNVRIETDTRISGSKFAVIA